jgi:hypothetical protein
MTYSPFTIHHLLKYCVWYSCLHYVPHVVNLIDVATGHRLDGPGIETRWTARLSASVQTGPGAHVTSYTMGTGKGKGLPQQAEVAQAVPGRLRSRIFLTFGTTSVVGHQPYAPAAFTPGEIPGIHFSRLSLLYNGYRFFSPGVQRPGRDVGETTPTTAEFKQILELYVCSRSGCSWHILG